MKNALLLTTARELKSDSAVRAELVPVLARWERYQHELKSGKLTDLDIQYTNSNRIQRLFNRAEPHFQVMRDHAHQC